MHLDRPEPLTDINEVRLATLTKALRHASEWLLRASVPIAEADPERSLAFLRASHAIRVVLTRSREASPDARFREILARLELLACELRERALAEGPASATAVAADLVDPIARDAARAPRWLRRYRGPAAI